MFSESDITGPVPIQLSCTECQAPHFDVGEWAHKPHKTHLCLECGHTWRPYPYPTVGVSEDEACSYYEIRNMPLWDIEDIVKTMKFKIAKNRTKPCPLMNPVEGGIRRHDHVSVEWMVKRAELELAELKEALAAGDIEEAKKEAADVANFMAFVHGNLVRKQEKEASDQESGSDVRSNKPGCR